MEMEKKLEHIDGLSENCDTLMLDMDGTLLDLAYDNYMWMDHIPAEYAKRNNLSEKRARKHLYAILGRLEGKLDWYSLDHWSHELDLDVVALHREQYGKIAFLPGAKQFLDRASDQHFRLLLVTNSHQETLDIKAEVTGIVDYFDGVYTSHALGYAKEDLPFWLRLQEKEPFNPARTVFIDDNISVLQAAREYGMEQLLHITQPDSRRAPRAHADFAGIKGVGDLI